MRSNVKFSGFIETDMVKAIPEKVKERIILITFRRFCKLEEIALELLVSLPLWGNTYTKVED